MLYLNTENKPVDPFIFAKSLHLQSSGFHKFPSQSRACTQCLLYIANIAEDEIPLYACNDFKTIIEISCILLIVSLSLRHLETLTFNQYPYN